MGQPLTTLLQNHLAKVSGSEKVFKGAQPDFCFKGDSLMSVAFAAGSAASRLFAAERLVAADTATGSQVYDYLPRTSAELRALYPVDQLYQTGYLPVDDGHSLYFERVGRPGGIPAVYLHGGPGANIKPANRGFFNPAQYDAVLYDQRGCGRSTFDARGSLHANTTDDLVRDLEALRAYMGFERWAVFGGSWGATLALKYAQEHPQAVSALMLRGIFLGTQQDLDWIYNRFGVARFYPEAWQHFVGHVSAANHFDLVHAYHELLNSRDPDVQRAAAIAWTQWEAHLAKLYVERGGIASVGDDADIVRKAMIENHYMANALFMRDVRLINGAAALSGIPTFIVNGRFDMLCPLANAWALHAAIAGSKLVIVPDSGHSFAEPGTLSALVDVTDYYAEMRSGG
jgi:proline iminopeptidase